MKIPKFFFIFLLFLSLVVISAVSSFEILSPDIFWHLKMGTDFLQHGLSPFFDHYSFTMPGSPIKNVGWPFQVMVSFFFNQMGVAGLGVLRFLIWSSGLALLINLFKRKNFSLVTLFLGVSFYLYIIIFHSEPRPDLLSLPFELLLISLLYSWRENKKQKTILLIGFLLFIWSNYHVSSAIGYVIVGAFLIEGFIQQISKKDGKRIDVLIFSSTVFVGVGFINHDWTHPVLAQALLSPKWVMYISEYANRGISQWEIPLMLYWVFVIVASVRIIRKKKISEAIVILVLAYKCWSMTKLFPHFIVVTLPFVMEEWDLFVKSVAPQHLKFVTKALLALVAIFIFCYDLDKIFIHALHPLNMKFNKGYFPYDVKEYIEEKKISGSVLNEYSAGGFLIWSFSQQLPVYIDGRTSILYPVEFYERYVKVATEVPAFKDETNKYNIKYVLGKAERVGEILETSLNSGLFEMEFFGESFALLARENGAFPFASQIFLHPECFDEKLSRQYEEEFSKAEKILPANSPLRIFLAVIDKYISTKNKDLLFRQPRKEWIESTYVSRLTAELAKRQNKVDAELFYLSSIRNPNEDDKVWHAALDCKIHNCDSAEYILNTMTKAGLRDDNNYEALQLLESIKQRRELKTYTEARLQKKRDSLKKYLDNKTVPKKPDWCHLRATTMSDDPKGSRFNFAIK